MTQITGIIVYKPAFIGTKSESVQPFICLENGTQMHVYLKNDNPFENRGFKDYEGKRITVEGEFIRGTFEVEAVLSVEEAPSAPADQAEPAPEASSDIPSKEEE